MSKSPENADDIQQELWSWTSCIWNQTYFRVDYYTIPQWSIRMSVPMTATGSVEDIGGGGSGNNKNEKEGQFQRKPRRSWSPMLHRKFLQALQKLGGSHYNLLSNELWLRYPWLHFCIDCSGSSYCTVATPKQIRDLMKVDSLTNDEVKNHLQKYRLHGRQPGHLIYNNNRHAAQFVVVGVGKNVWCWKGVK